MSLTSVAKIAATIIDNNSPNVCLRTSSSFCWAASLAAFRNLASSDSFSDIICCRLERFIADNTQLKFPSYSLALADNLTFLESPIGLMRSCVNDFDVGSPAVVDDDSHVMDCQRNCRRSKKNRCFRTRSTSAWLLGSIIQENDGELEIVLDLDLLLYPGSDVINRHWEFKFNVS